MHDSDNHGSEAQMPAKNGTLLSMKYLGNTYNGREFIYNPASKDPASQLTPVPAGPWQHGGNGNPRNMLEAVQALLPDMHIVFLVERDFNRNIVLYCVNESSPGVVDRSNAMTVMWLMISAPPQAAGEELDLGDVYTEDLTALERTLAYGVTNVSVSSDNQFTVRVRAVNGEDITVKYNSGERVWEAMIRMSNTFLYLDRFRIFTEPRKFAPWPKTVELHVDARLAAGTTITYHFQV